MARPIRRCQSPLRSASNITRPDVDCLLVESRTWASSSRPHSSWPWRSTPASARRTTFILCCLVWPSSRNSRRSSVSRGRSTNSSHCLATSAAGAVLDFEISRGPSSITSACRHRCVLYAMSPCHSATNGSNSSTPPVPVVFADSPKSKSHCRECVPYLIVTFDWRENYTNNIQREGLCEHPHVLHPALVQTNLFQEFPPRVVVDTLRCSCSGNVSLTLAYVRLSICTLVFAC